MKIVFFIGYWLCYLIGDWISVLFDGEFYIRDIWDEDKYLMYICVVWNIFMGDEKFSKVVYLYVYGMFFYM